MRITLSFLLLAVLLTACSYTKPVASTDDSDVLATESYKVTTGTKDLVDPVHGKRIGFWYGSVGGVQGERANGIAYLHVFADDASIASANVNIVLAESGEEYVVVLVDESGEEVELGVLTSLVGDVRHTVRLESANNLSTFLTLRVYRVSGAKKVQVAESTLKQPPAGTW